MEYTISIVTIVIWNEYNIVIKSSHIHTQMRHL